MNKRIAEYKDFGECLFLDNGTVELIVPLAFGPRVIGCRLLGRENLFYEQPAGDTLFRHKGWRIYGGHRLWLAPENERSYWPDNEPVEHTPREDGVALRQTADGYLRVEKSIEVSFAADANSVAVVHRAKNVGDTPMTAGLWAISAMRAGGEMTVPFAGNVEAGGGYTPNRFLSLWGDSSLADERLTFTAETLKVRQLPRPNPFKLGLLCRDGVARYEVGGQVFEKRFDGRSVPPYPDNNVNFEVYASEPMLEVESLSPLVELPPGETAEHRELWSIRPVADVAD